MNICAPPNAWPVAVAYLLQPAFFAKIAEFAKTINSRRLSGAPTPDHSVLFDVETAACWPVTLPH
jgi:hypothetical protein